MVTQIYTAPIKVRSPQAVGGYGAVDSAKKQAQAALASGDDLPQGTSKGLAAVEEQAQKGVISIQSILTDFQSTMDALGVPDSVREEVSPYLQVIGHQSQRSQPATGLMKQNFKAASDTLDNYISGALGQKSSVVRDWVDALLLQPIEYHSDTPLTMPASTTPKPIFTSSSAAANPTTVTTTPAVQPMTKEEQGDIKTRLKEASTAVKSGKAEDAMATYQALLNEAETKQWPDVKARALYQMGKLSEQQGNAPQAKTDYEGALDALENVSQPKFHAKVHRALGGILTKEGKLDDALGHFTAAMVLDTQQNDAVGQSLTLNQVGQVYKAQGDKESALKAYKEALNKVKDDKPPFMGDILQNIAALHREEGRTGKAMRYMKESLDLAKSQGHRAGMKSALEGIASIYLETGKPEKAYKALQSSLYKL